jgi:membrane-bound lytic murein transglycosylase A
MKNVFYTSTIFILILFITGCAPKYNKEFEKISKANLKQSSWKELKDFENDDLNLSLEVFKKACVRSKRYNTFKNACEKALKTSNAKQFFQENFTPFKLYDDKNSEQGLITGYYEPLLNGSRIKTGKFKYPIYNVPKDLITVDLSSVYPELKKYRLRGQLKGNKLIPYNTRAQMGKKIDLEPICYVDSKVDLFFLQIQGSGKVKFQDGTIINVGYANQNGRSYNSIGKAMIKKGYITPSQGSLQGIKKWFEENPTKIDEVLNINESYVFFQESKRSATGALGVELVAKRNLAVDRKYIPLGMPVFIQTSNPINKKEINQLMIAADVGGAIKGQIRADFFWGNSKMAEETAGRMKEKGILYMLIPNNL